MSAQAALTAALIQLDLGGAVAAETLTRALAKGGYEITPLDCDVCGREPEFTGHHTTVEACDKAMKEQWGHADGCQAPAEHHAYEASR